jgi:NadR type nicotinamide-nucleotide adenylyltransferase
MEERTESSMRKPLLIAITGPECTGKSTLAVQLAHHYEGAFIPEYARAYIESLDIPYTFRDVEHIAETQLSQAKDALTGSQRIVFLDTYLIITKVWFNVLYGYYPQWMDEEIKKQRIDLYLLCDTSIPWTADKVRENGGEMREILYQTYKDELIKSGCRYTEITGTGEERIKHAKEAIELFFPDIYHENIIL